MKRLFDITAAIILILTLIVPMLIVAFAVKMTSSGPILYWSDRVGRGNALFRMPKFRSMRTDAPEVASHLLSDPESLLTPIGSTIRKTSLDELPQIWCVLIGDMSLVGPRPALFNQDDLTELRSSVGVDRLLPGVTGWAQVNGRDELSIKEKVKLDKEYLDKISLSFDIWVLWLTFIKVIKSDSVSH